jgi:hypothetical protein
MGCNTAVRVCLQQDLLLITPRSYELAGEQEIREAFRSGTRTVLYQAPTGSGKQTVFGRVA